jgi:hypothetical protein
MHCQSVGFRNVTQRVGHSMLTLRLAKRSGSDRSRRHRLRLRARVKTYAWPSRRGIARVTMEAASITSCIDRLLQDALPDGWVAMIDQATNCAFYADTRTGQTQWARPIADFPNARADVRALCGSSWLSTAALMFAGTGCERTCEWAKTTQHYAPISSVVCGAAFLGATKRAASNGSAGGKHGCVERASR